MKEHFKELIGTLLDFEDFRLKEFIVWSEVFAKMTGATGWKSKVPGATDKAGFSTKCHTLFFFLFVFFCSALFVIISYGTSEGRVDDFGTFNWS